MEVFVYNRWGQLIWKGTTPTDFWDGTVNKHAVAEDVYVWKATYSYLSSQDGTIQSSSKAVSSSIPLEI